MAIRIERCGAGDEAFAARICIERKSFPVQPGALAPFLNDARNILLVALDGDAIAGYVVAHELDRIDGARMMLVYDVDVADGYQRQGIGRAMMEGIEDLCAERGCRTMWLSTGRDDERANAFYGSLGGARKEDVVYSWRFDTNR